jgi:RNA polymerase sigma-70 factor (ECF subfamily)
VQPTECQGLAPVGFTHPATTCWEKRMADDCPTTRRTPLGDVGGPGDAGCRKALARLCRDYWFPLYVFIRRRGHGPEQTEALAQGFLADLLDRGDLSGLDGSKGRFRSFLRAACDRYLADLRDAEPTARRGHGAVVVSIDRLDAEERYARQPAHERTAERLYEHQWATALLARVMERLEAECAHEGNIELFRWLRPGLTGDGPAAGYLVIGGELCMPENVVRGAARRMRLRYRELLREEVARTTADPDDVDEEIGELMIALSSG